MDPHTPTNVHLETIRERESLLVFLRQERRALRQVQRDLRQARRVLRQEMDKELVLQQ
jgi:hypothetical protein